ncbi:ATP binding, partial [Ceratobasidium sp. 370]
SDIWAFGCVALEILSQLRPYHVITNEHRVTLAIKSGRSPSAKPDYPYAASCLTDTLWNIIKKCWHPHQLSRPSSTSLLSAINGLIEVGELNPSTSTPLRSAKDISEEPLDWPEKVDDLAWKLVKFDKKKISVQRMADVWRYSQDDLPKVVSSSKPSMSQIFAVKVLRAPGGLGSGDITVDPFQQALRRVVWERLSINHQHIIQLLGIDTSYGRYPGLVMEYCGGGNLEDVLESAALDDEHFPVRCMIQILKGLEFLHNLPSPLAHGDLTPHNILADSKGTLKLTLTAAPNDDAISARYLSPELIAKDDGSWPTPHADMWSFGCVACWMYVKTDPYPECRLEYEVISNIIDGLPPYSVAQLSRIGPLGGSHVMPSAPWITNGTLAAVLRCWNQDGNRRPTATACLNDLAELLDDAGRKLVPVSPDVRNLTGKVTTPDHPRKKILGHCRGIWSYIADELSITKERNLLSFIIGGGGNVGLYSPGFLRRSVEVSVKGIRLAPRARSGDLLDSAKQGIYHEIALL